MQQYIATKIKIFNIILWIFRILLFLALLYCCFSLSGCAGFKKVQTVTITTTKIKIDTVILIKTDTVKLFQSVYLTDTAKLENKTSVAKSYFSTEKKRIVLELSGKPFNVPVTIYKQVEQKQTEKIKEVKPVLTVGSKITIYIFSFMLLLVLFWLFKNSLKNLS
jgi:hypothetical protein